MNIEGKPIFIVGFTAVGKTTIGARLAKALARDFVDTDKYIEAKYHSSISSMFASCGIEKFRKREKTILIELGQRKNSVVSTGGGLATYDDNMDWMLSKGIVIYLHTPMDVLIERLYLVRDDRAITEGLDRVGVEKYVHETLPRRTPIYEKAQIHIDVSDLITLEDELNVVGRILEAMNR